MTKVRDDRFALTIPYPSHIPKARGIHAVGKFGVHMKINCTEAERETIAEAAEHVGVSMSQFIRWCGIMAAREVLNYDGPSSTEPQSVVEPDSSTAG